MKNKFLCSGSNFKLELHIWIVKTIGSLIEEEDHKNLAQLANEFDSTWQQLVQSFCLIYSNNIHFLHAVDCFVKSADVIDEYLCEWIREFMLIEIQDIDEDDKVRYEEPHTGFVWNIVQV